MKQQLKGSLLCALSVVAISFEAKASLPSTLHLDVRGEKIAMPLKLRIRIKDFQPSQRLSLSGLMSNSLKNEDLNCRFMEKDMLPLVGLYNLKASNSWVCEEKKSGVFFPIQQSMKLSSKFPFVSINGKKYRGTLNLVQNHKKLMLINEVSIEDYLTGLINKEISSKYPAEAVKAQAVAARSYALATLADRKSRTRLYDLKGSEVDQVYQGASYEDARSRRLVEATRGQVLVHKSQILKAYYHAASGGHSELPQNVWLNRANPVELGAFEAKPSPFDDRFAPTPWSITLSASIGLRWPEVGRLKDIFIVKRSKGKRVKEIMLVGEKGSKLFGGAQFRKLLGYRWLKSTLFSIRKNKNSWSLEGKGFGHGVGMSQLGAKVMAKNGKTAEEILSFYYPKASLQNLNTMGTR